MQSWALWMHSIACPHSLWLAAVEWKKYYIIYIYLHSYCTYSTHNYTHPIFVEISPIIAVCNPCLLLILMNYMSCLHAPVTWENNLPDITCILHNNHICTQINLGPIDRYIIGIFWSNFIHRCSEDHLWLSPPDPSKGATTRKPRSTARRRNDEPGTSWAVHVLGPRLDHPMFMCMCIYVVGQKC